MKKYIEVEVPDDWPIPFAETLAHRLVDVEWRLLDPAPEPVACDINGLKPCPFCGSGVILSDENETGQFSPTCRNSDCPEYFHGFYDTREEAIAAWNTRAHPPVMEAMGWRPIESALKGKEILLFVPDESPQYVAGWWCETDDGDGWAYADETLYELAVFAPEPTHWMPLPDAPDLCSVVAPEDADSSPDKLYDDVSGFEIPGFQPCAQCKTPRACNTYRCAAIPLETNPKT